MFILMYFSLSRVLSRMSESTPAPVPTRLVRGSGCQAVPLAKVTQVSRVQRAKTRVERRHLGRGHMQRQNRICQKTPRHVAHTRNSFLHQPCQRSLNHWSNLILASSLSYSPTSIIPHHLPYHVFHVLHQSPHFMFEFSCYSSHKQEYF